MRHPPSRTLLAFIAAGLLVPTGAMLGAAPALARHHHHAHQVYKSCRRSSGTAGLIGGGAGGALLGHAVLGGPVGIAAGAVGGAFGGRAIDRSMTAHKRCRYYRR